MFRHELVGCNQFVLGCTDRCGNLPWLLERQFDIHFLDEVFQDSTRAQSFVAQNQEYQSLVNKLIGLYHEITRKALENEQNS